MRAWSPAIAVALVRTDCPNRCWLVAPPVGGAEAAAATAPLGAYSLPLAQT